MRQLKNTTKAKEYKHLTEKERYIIEALLEQKIKISKIGEYLNKHRSTIHREIKQGEIKRLTSELTEISCYRANVGQRRYEERVSNRERSLKIGKDHILAEYIKTKIIKDKYSPDVIIGEIKEKGLKFETTICMKTLYNYIDKGILNGISNKNLLWKHRKKKKKHNKVRVCLKNRLSLSIEERPESVEKREEYGHWEIDTVKGKKNKNKACLMTLSERKTREELILKLQAATSKKVDNALTKLEKNYGEEFNNKFKSITADNGGEFLDWKTLEESKMIEGAKRTVFYFAHPYSSWERGTNENQNRMIRRFIPKGSDISKVTNKRIKEIEIWINNYPRKILGYKSSSDFVNTLQLTSNLQSVAL